MLVFLRGTSDAEAPLQILGDGKLRLFNYHLQEFDEIQFRAKPGGAYLPEGLKQIGYLLRNREDEAIVDLDPKLIDLVDHLQDRFGADTVEIVSGYRTKELNSKLLQSGHSVSPVSFHTQGKAMDIHLDEVDEKDVENYARSLKVGGVGYYPSLDFVHVDTGPVRTWEEKVGPRKRIGVLHPQSSLQLTSDKNRYVLDEKPRLQWSSAVTLPRKGFTDLQLEKFWRGKWMKVEAAFDHKPFPSVEVILKERRCPPSVSAFGKYRILFQDESGNLNSSNEFYFKKSFTQRVLFPSELSEIHHR